MEQRAFRLVPVRSGAARLTALAVASNALFLMKAEALPQSTVFVWAPSAASAQPRTRGSLEKFQRCRLLFVLTHRLGGRRKRPGDRLTPESSRGATQIACLCGRDGGEDERNGGAEPTADLLGGARYISKT